MRFLAIYLGASAALTFTWCATIETLSHWFARTDRLVIDELERIWSES